MRSSDLTTIGNRIAHIRGGLSQAKFAERLGVNKNTIGNYERGDRKPDSDFLEKLAAHGYNIHWVITGEGPMRLSDTAPMQPRSYEPTTDDARGVFHSGVNEIGDQYALVPLYDVHASAGHGAVVMEEQVTDSLAFKRDWIYNELHANPSDLYLIYVDGESMEPTLRPGDVILVDRRSAETVPRDGIYVLRMDDSLLVKRLQRLPGRQVKVTSDNPAYEPFQLNLDATGEDLAIIGRVVWSGRRM